MRAVLHHLERPGVEILGPRRVGDLEQPVVEPEDRGRRAVGGDPVDRAPHLSSVRRLTAAGGGIVGATHRRHRARRRIGLERTAPDDVGVAKPHLASRGEAAKTGDGFRHEVLAFDEELASEGHPAGARAGVAGMVEGVERPRSSPSGQLSMTSRRGRSTAIARGALRSSSSRTHRSRRPISVRLAFRVIPTRSQKSRIAAGG